MSARFGESAPAPTTEVPGPRSRELADRLARVESPNITKTPSNAATDGPIFWADARGANVRDVDGNVYVDLTAGFAVTAAGHANPRIARAIREQAARLPHALGDVYPAEIKVELLERLASLAPGDLGVSILASAGAEAVEAALKTAVMRTGRPGVVAFTGGYHGLTYGALAATHRAEFRDPFRAQLYGGVRFAPYPDAYHWEGEGDVGRAALAEVRRLLDEAEDGDSPVGAILVEPVQGRGGIVVPPPEFLHGLRRLCDGRRTVLIMDEVYTGVGRTGRWFACEHSGVEPDILVVGKALTGAVPLSAAMGTPEVMSAWPPSTGEAIHTSTFLGNPVACAAALAALDEIEERDLVGRAATLGERLGNRLEGWRERYPVVDDVRGLGLMWAVELADTAGSRTAAADSADTAAGSGTPAAGSHTPATDLAAEIMRRSLRRGVILLTEGQPANILAFTPPLVITDAQLAAALDVIEELLADTAGMGNSS